ncbi:MAG: lamin tail domain-containing protein [Planctomycetota bacterium]
MGLARAVSSALLVASFAAAQDRVRISEILIDPVGPNAGNQIVELHNYGNLTIDLTGWNLVVTNATVGLPGIALPAGQYTQLHVGANGVSNPGDIFLPGMPVLGASGSLALFRSPLIANPADLVDFVSWGGGQGAIAVAVAANLWPSPTDTVQPPAIEGHTMASYDQYVYSSNGGSESWFDDGTPTLGARNDGGAIFATGYGCPQSVYGPQIGSGENHDRPWIGESWRLETGYMPVLPTLLWVAIGVQPFAPLALDGFGIPGCFWSVSPDVVLLRFVQTYPDPIFLQLPASTALIDFPLDFQALVPAPNANPAGLLPTRAGVAYPGSR